MEYNIQEAVNRDREKRFHVSRLAHREKLSNGQWRLIIEKMGIFYSYEGANEYIEMKIAKDKEKNKC